MLDRGVARLVVIDGGLVLGVLSRHDVLRALVRTDRRVHENAAAVLAQLDEPDVTLEVEHGHVTVGGTVSRRSLVRVLHDRLEAIDGVIAPDEAELGWRTDDLAPTYSIA